MSRCGRSGQFSEGLRHRKIAPHGKRVAKGAAACFGHKFSSFDLFLACFLFFCVFFIYFFCFFVCVSCVFFAMFRNLNPSQSKICDLDKAVPRSLRPKSRLKILCSGGVGGFVQNALTHQGSGLIHIRCLSPDILYSWHDTYGGRVLRTSVRYTVQLHPPWFNGLVCPP